MSLYRVESGLIFDDQFNGDSGIWELSPPADCQIADGQMLLRHSQYETTALFELPNEPTVLFEVTADYTPMEMCDEGGIVIWKDGTRKLEFLETVDTTSEEYSRWRAWKKQSNWFFSADRGSGWETIDNGPLSAIKAGIVLKNKQKPGYQQLIVKRAIVCKGKSIKIGDLEQGFQVKISDHQGLVLCEAVVQAEMSGVEMELPSAHIYGYIDVYDSDNRLVVSMGALDLYGGDIFCLGTKLQVRWNEQELKRAENNHLGTMYDNQIEVEMDMYNPSDSITATNVIVKIAEYAGKFGYEWVDIALDGVSYAKELIIEQLLPQQTVSFFVKVIRRGFQFQLEPGRFFIHITHL